MKKALVRQHQGGHAAGKAGRLNRKVEKCTRIRALHFFGKWD